MIEITRYPVTADVLGATDLKSAATIRNGNIHRNGVDNAQRVHLLHSSDIFKKKEGAYSK